jgi:hypothetical protein
MARRLSLFSGLAALGLMAAVGAPGSASASELPHSRTPAKPTAQANLAPIRQRAVSTAVGIGGDALATASNQSLAQQDSVSLGGRRGATLQLNRSPTVQTAVSAAISVGGNTAALASNNGATLGNTSGIGLTRPVSLLELGRAPSTSTAVSTAISIGGVPIPVR